MFFPLLITLAIAAIADYIRRQVKEEIESLGAGIIAVICLFFSIFFAPMPIKILLVFVAWFSTRSISSRSIEL
ncbi:MAG: hypothetical protein ACOC0N_07500 [Chroococcales cyanobacterium]